MTESDGSGREMSEEMKDNVTMSIERNPSQTVWFKDKNIYSGSLVWNEKKKQQHLTLEIQF